MIKNYTRPQSLIKQELEKTPDLVPERINPVVIGPEYLLNRFGKETIPSSAVATLAGTYNLKYFDESGAETLLTTAAHTLDAASLDVVVENGVALVGDLSGDIRLDDMNTPDTVRVVTGNFKGGTLHTGLAGREVQVGDYLRTVGAAGSRDRKILSLVGKDVPATYGTNTAKDDSNVASSATNLLDSTQGQAGVSHSIAGGDAGFLYTAGANAAYAGINVYGTDAPAILPTGKPGIRYEMRCVVAGAAGVARLSVRNAVTGEFYETSVLSVNGSLDFWEIPVALTGAVVTFQHSDDLAVGDYVTIDQTEVFTGDGDAATDLLVTGTYAGLVDTTYVVKVKRSADAGTALTGAILEIFDTNKTDDRIEVVSGATISQALGNSGLTLAVSAAAIDLVAGDSYFIHCVAEAESTTEFDKVRVEGVAVDLAEITAVTDPVVGKIVKKGTLTVESGYAVAGHDVIVSAPAVDVDGINALLQDDEGTLNFSYRAVVLPGVNEDPILVGQDQSKVGTADMDNELGYGVARAIAGAQGSPVYAVRTADDSAASFSEALLKISRADFYYAIVPMTENQAALDAVSEHVTKMSGEAVKNFRRAYVGIDSPGEYVTHTEDINATVTQYAGEFKLLTLEGGSPDITLLGLKAGDTVKFPVSEDQYTIAEILGPDELILTEDLGAAISTPTEVELWRADTTSSQGDYVGNTAANFSNRRIVTVWQESGTRTVGGIAKVVPNRFLAAEIAGLRCAVLPQQGLTRTEVETITAAPSMYLRYEQEELDDIAAQGVFIVAQDSSDGAIYIRHQLTTETSEGSLQYEDSIGVNFDNISFSIKDIIDSVIGRKNGTPATLRGIKEDTEGVLDGFTQADDNTREIGPALVSYSNLEVGLHSVLKDQFEVGVDLEFALPLNRGTVTLRARVSG